MEFLKFLEGLRTPFGDAFFSAVTHLGEETIFILVGLLFFWCINKKQGYYILSVGFIGTVINQFLKLTFRVPRPWIKDSSFTIVESARAEATGYSFPSGHTQSGVGVFGSIARLFSKDAVSTGSEINTAKKRGALAVRILCIASCILIPLSRMYLGVHTPADVGVSFLIATALILILYPIVNKALENPKYMHIFFGCMTAFALTYLIYVLVFPFPADIDATNLASGTKHAYQMLGCIVGLWIAYGVDTCFTHFDTKAVWWAQILKLVLGLIPLLLIKALLKNPLYALCGGSYIADGIRYFLIVLFAGCLWPMTFHFWAKLGQKSK